MKNLAFISAFNLLLRYRSLPFDVAFSPMQRGTGRESDPVTWIKLALMLLIDIAMKVSASCSSPRY
jgi:hypothetical protein